MLFRYDHFCFVGMGDHYLQFDYTPDQVFLLDHIILVCNVHAFKHYNPAPSPQFLLKDNFFPGLRLRAPLPDPLRPGRHHWFRLAGDNLLCYPCVVQLTGFSCCICLWQHLRKWTILLKYVLQHIATLPGDKWEHPDAMAVSAIIDRLVSTVTTGDSPQSPKRGEGETSPTFQAPNLHNWPPGVPWPEHNASLLLQLSLAHRLPF